MRGDVGNVASLRRSAATTPAAALLQFVYETAQPLLVLPPGVVALTPWLSPTIRLLGVVCVVWCQGRVCLVCGLMQL